MSAIQSDITKRILIVKGTKEAEDIKIKAAKDFKTYTYREISDDIFEIVLYYPVGDYFVK